MEKYLVSHSAYLRQHGAATLLTAVVLLFVVSLVGILTARSVLVETQTSADNYRANQALNAANAAMDQAVAYFNQGGMDQINNSTKAPDKDGLVDFTEPNNFECPNPAPTSQADLTDFIVPRTGSAALTNSFARFYFDNEGCGGTSSSFNRGMAVARGWSDDCEAMRTITNCLVDTNVFNLGTGPKQPFVSKAGVGVFGNAEIINRFNNSSIWAGGAFGAAGAAFGTYLRLPSKEIYDYTEDQLIDSNKANNSQEISDRNSGIGYDIIDNDPTLANKTSTHPDDSPTPDLNDPSKNQFFSMFFSVTKSQMINLAESGGQYFTPSSSASPVGKSGLIWFEGDLSLHNNDTVGTKDKPAILIINGDLALTGGPLHGIIYVTGELEITGNPVVYGSMISENGPNSGGGTVTLVYRPFNDGGYGSGDIFMGGTAVSGSWTDWNQETW